MEQESEHQLIRFASRKSARIFSLFIYCSDGLLFCFIPDKKFDSFSEIININN